jgi:hypothetical protein
LYFERNCLDSLINAFKMSLSGPRRLTVKHSRLIKTEKFRFMFARFLASAKFLPLSEMGRLDVNFPSKHFDGVVLSTPESPSRRKRFQYRAPIGMSFLLFDGILFNPSWIGCAFSYKMLAFNALKSGINQLLVVEDDAIFPVDFKSKLDSIYKFLDQYKSWDMFSGLIVDITLETRVLDVIFYDGTMFIVLDRMISNVCNIYNRSVLELLSKWNPDDRNDQTNTVDRYLNSKEMRVVTTVPFIIDHERGSQSTLWKISAHHYADWIHRSQQLIISLACEYLRTMRGRDFQSSAIDHISF